jgi:hypothetical protein
MRRKQAFAFIIFCVVASSVLTAAATAQEPPGTPHVYKTVGDRQVHVYTEAPDKTLFSGKRPILVTIHGG